MKAIEPKLDFLKSTEAALFADVVNQPIVRRALDTALLQFVVNQKREDHFEAATKLQYELQGARQLVAIFLNLTEPETNPKPDTSGTLQWHSKPPQPPAQQQPQPRSPRRPKA